MNELSMLFHQMGISTRDVLAAARTKWNFLDFTPGLVGGHCIPVDPYYLAHKAMEIGYHPDTILVGRRINDQMGAYVAKESIKLVINAGKNALESTALILGAAFKENVGDLRNTLVIDLVHELESFGVTVVVHDPLIDDERLRAEGVRPVGDPFADGQPRYDMVVLAVPHWALTNRPFSDFVALLDPDYTPGVLIDIKGIFAEAAAVEPGIEYCTL
jgi:UDP-N-acetyl-D-galactosamine dehydrogenase